MPEISQSLKLVNTPVACVIDEDVKNEAWALAFPALAISLVGGIAQVCLNSAFVEHAIRLNIHAVDFAAWEKVPPGSQRSSWSLGGWHIAQHRRVTREHGANSNS